MNPPPTETIESSPVKKLTRRKFLQRAGLGAGVVAIGLAGYSSLIEPNEVDVTKLELKLSRLAATFDGFKIALLSDFHFGAYTGKREVSAAVRAANQLQPDVMALLGDFVTEPLTGDPRSGAKKAEPCAQVLSGLRSRLGTFAILGNHDYATDPELVADALKSYGITLLRNANRAFEQDGARLWMLGVSDVDFGGANLVDALTRVPEAETKMLLVHEPDFADHSSQHGIDIQFSGHSHGGQVRIPGVHPLWLPPLAKKYYDGYYRVGPMQLYTNRGIGTVGLPFRFCCPPEVTLVTLRAA
ncbi:MAG: metallophosphoesterase [Terriglobales bacterium]